MRGGYDEGCRLAARHPSKPSEGMAAAVRGRRTRSLQIRCQAGSRPSGGHPWTRTPTSSPPKRNSALPTAALQPTNPAFPDFLIYDSEEASGFEVGMRGRGPAPVLRGPALRSSADRPQPQRQDLRAGHHIRAKGLRESRAAGSCLTLAAQMYILHILNAVWRSP